MSDQAVEAQPTDQAPTAPAEGAQEAPKTFTQADIDQILRDRLKRQKDQFGDIDSLKKAATELAELKESQKTEQQKIADRAAAAEKERDEAVTQTLRYKAAATFSVGPDYFDLLGSGTEEEVLSRAERLGTLLSASEELVQVKAELEALKTGRPSPSGRPVESLKPGATPTEVSSMDDAYPANWIPQRRTQSS